MADTSLGRASLSVTADLSNFVQGIEDASAKSRDLGKPILTTNYRPQVYDNIFLH